jgi:hypothetical protein
MMLHGEATAFQLGMEMGAWDFWKPALTFPWHLTD